MFCPVCRSEYPDDWKACPKDATLLLASAQIGKYTIEGLLGVGGMGAVYRASNPDTRARVAIKVMHPAVASAESSRVRFQREAAAVAALNTTHVVKVFDFGTEADGTLFLVMEFLDGHPLRDEIALPPDGMELARVQMIMEGALRGLGAAHKAGIIHRDLKPENVFVAQTDDGEVPKLVDFGIARVRTKDSDLTRTGTLVGTASYMAPEQIVAQSGDIGPWSDVWAMGTILYELLAGQAAFGGDSVTDVLGRVLRVEITPLAELRPGLPAEVYKLVARCMNADPTARPQDADALRRELAGVRLVAPGTPIPSAKVIKRTEPALARTEASNIETGATAAASSPIAAVSAASSSADGVRSTSTSTVASGERAGDAVKKRGSLVPTLIAGGVIGVGVVAFLAIRGTDDPKPKPIDAAVAVAPPPDAAVASDAPPPAIDAPSAPADMVKIQGTFELGVKNGKPPDELPLQTATLAAFWVDKTEMTKDQVAKALGDKLPKSTVQKAKADRGDAPARFVDHATATAACAALGKRLPTELEWEAAAQKTPQGKHRIDLAAPSPDCSAEGLCDFLGSLIEWTSTPHSTKPTDKTMIVRGASYRYDPDQVVVSIHNRQAVDPGSQDNELGFRCAKDEK